MGILACSQHEVAVNRPHYIYYNATESLSVDGLKVVFIIHICFKLVLKEATN